MHAFDPNDYRKRVLAAVERRGGIEASDAFELYDIPLDEAGKLGDAEVRARVEEVWGFWQKQRDHPKYRVLAGLLVDAHDDLSAPLLQASSRRVEAERVEQLRERRDSERYEMIDAAIDRLVQRHGGIPAGKVAGLEDIGKLSGLTPEQVRARLRRHRILDEAAAPAPAATGVSPQRRQQIRKLLAEYDRLLPGEPVPTLLALLGLNFTKAREAGEIHLRAEALRARTRELSPGRVRVVLDELLVHVSDLLEGDAVVDDYLRAVIDDATDLLRPQVRAAVLVEDSLVAGDYEFLVGEAIAAGVDRAAAEKIILALAAELGTTVEGKDLASNSAPAQQASGPPPISFARPDRTGGTTRSSGTTSGRTGTDSGGGHTGSTGAGAQDTGPFTRTGQPGAGTASAQGHSDAAQGGSNYRRVPPLPPPPPARAWEEPLKAARAALRAGHPLAAKDHVAQAQRYVGADSAGTTAVRPVAELVDRVLSEAAVHWRGATTACAGKRFMEALGHLEYLERSASDVPNPDGRGLSLNQLLAQARSALAEADRLFAAAPAAPAAARMRALRAVFDVCADHAGTVAALTDLPVEPPGPVTAKRQPDGTVVITWSPSPTEQVEYRVTRVQSDGSSRVVGRTRGTTLEDGAAGTGPLPVYGVVASVAGRASELTRSDAGPGSGTPAHSGGQASQGGPHEGAAPATAATPDGMPTVTALSARAGLLTFTWPVGITEVMVIARVDAPPRIPDDPEADRKWKVTNTRYQIDGGAKLPIDLPRPCHLAIASCRRDPSGTLTIATAFAPAARIHLDR
ncbi:Ig-like domain repeat protein [Nocardia sp. NPDC058058]|uniref:Ig-like domain repeat protein n=1 Tax=Nocardia sp. NPDC058058 TaxID=3346317 RepID=UPI0036DAC8B4